MVPKNQETTSQSRTSWGWEIVSKNMNKTWFSNDAHGQ